MMELYDKTCEECSALITKRYSTSFSLGIRVFAEEYREPIYSIYGFVRFADEIVDTFHNYPRRTLFNKFREDTFHAIKEKISLNPVLHAFQKVVHEYDIPLDLIDPFFDSMEMDLKFESYKEELYQKYIHGSAEVVGLMCLKVFCKGDEKKYEELLPAACALGSAFQKINFLRDMQSDFQDRGRVYFPGVNYLAFDDEQKKSIEADIELDFNKAYRGILKLPDGCRLGVYLAYVYYWNLFKKIRGSSAARVISQRIRVNDAKKLLILCSSALKHRLGAL